MSASFMPRRASSGVPKRRPFMSPSTGSIGSPMPQDRKLALRNRLAAAWPPPNSAARSANWCEAVAPRDVRNTGAPRSSSASARALAVETIFAA
jgi:hypothetical protein